MTISSQQLAPGKIQLNISVSPEKYEKQLKTKALILSQKIKIHGFRPGKAPYEIFKKHFGHLELIKESLNEIVSRTYNQAIKEQKITPALLPKIEVLKMAPDNPIEYKAEIIIFPQTTLPEFSKIKIKPREIKTQAGQIETLLKQLQKSRAAEALKAGPAQSGDRVEFDLQIITDGDQNKNEPAQNQSIILGETPVAPGLAENITGLKAGQKKTFKQQLPTQGLPEQYAGKNAEITVKINKVWQVMLPELNDDFARGLNVKFANLAALKNQLLENLKSELARAEKDRQAKEILDQLTANSVFTNIAEELIEKTKDKIIENIKNQLKQQKIEWTDYLQKINKSEAELQKDFQQEAEKQIKITSILSQIIKQEQIEVLDQEIEKELNAFRHQFKSKDEIEKKINLPEIKLAIKEQLLNKKAIEFLREKIVRLKVKS